MHELNKGNERLSTSGTDSDLPQESEAKPSVSNPDKRSLKNPNRTRVSRAFYGLTSAVLIYVLMDQLGLIRLIPVLRGLPGLILVFAVLGAFIGITRGARILHSAAAATLA